ncbi:1725_t:CDS:1, partial [Cetraspora pellucida]
HDGERSEEREMHTTERNEIVTSSSSSLENEKVNKSENETLLVGNVPKSQFEIPQIQLDLKPESRPPTSLGLGITSNEVTVPVLVISVVEELKDETNDGDGSDDGGDQFVDAEEWGS